MNRQNEWYIYIYINPWVKHEIINKTKKNEEMIVHEENGILGY